MRARLSRHAVEFQKVTGVCLVIFGVAWFCLAELGARLCAQSQAAYMEDSIRGGIEYGFSSTRPREPCPEGPIELTVERLRLSLPL